MELMDKIQEIARKDGRFSSQAFVFVFQALEVATKRVARRDPPGHVSGRELLEGIRLLGLEQFGYLAGGVFESWGVRSTRDFGEIVFVMVQENLMGKNDRDSIEDFENVYDFEEVFEKGFTFERSGPDES